MTPLRFGEARQCVIDKVRQHRSVPPIEHVPLLAASGRVLAREAQADRPYPPVARSLRDGFAVHAGSFTGDATIVGEVRAGQTYPGSVGENEAVEIMTGAPIPDGTDAVIMVEHVERSGARLHTRRLPKPGDHVSPAASHASAGETVVASGVRLDSARIAALATIGVSEVPVYAAPRVAILSTGDEIVPITADPAAFEVRNSNTYSLAAQVTRAGGLPQIAPIVRDDFDQTRAALEHALDADLLLISGGVSAGKYDLVEKALASYEAEFYFDRVLLQPGQPLVFGRARRTFFLGLPGNPVSTAVTFELIGRAALDLLGGVERPHFPTLYARLAQGFTQRTGLTRCFPGDLASGYPEVTPVHYAGSADVFALARANCFILARDDREQWDAGDLIEVVPR